MLISNDCSGFVVSIDTAPLKVVQCHSRKMLGISDESINV